MSILIVIGFVTAIMKLWNLLNKLENFTGIFTVFNASNNLSRRILIDLKKQLKLLDDGRSYAGINVWTFSVKRSKDAIKSKLVQSRRAFINKN